MDAPACEEGVADDEVILITEVDYSFSIVREVTYSMIYHESLSVLVFLTNLISMIYFHKFLSV